MKKALAVLATIAVVSNFGSAGFAVPCPADKAIKPCPAVKTQCHKKAVKPCPCEKTAKPCPAVKKEEVKGAKTGGAAELKRPMTLTKEEKMLKVKRDAKKEAVKKSKEVK